MSGNIFGKTIAFHETLYFGETATDGAEVLVEDSNEHVEQMVTVPEIHTQAVNPETGDHLATVSGNNAESDDWYLNTSDLTKFDWKINDSVSLNSITPDTDYTLVTVVMNKDTGKLVTNNSLFFLQASLRRTQACFSACSYCFLLSRSCSSQ